MSPTKVPPRYVPTLTEVVKPTARLGPDVPQQAPAGQRTDNLEDLITLRVMQKVNLVLERRVREAVAQLVLEHTQTLMPRLMDEMEQVVRESVGQAMAQQQQLERARAQAEAQEPGGNAR
jgi:hypothetical protein